MKGTPVFFGDVVAKAAEIVSTATLPTAFGTPLLIRDIYGVVSIALNVKRSEHQEAVSKLEAEAIKLGVYAASPSVVCADDLFDAGQIFDDPSIVQFVVPGTELSVRMLERQVTGQDWLSSGDKADGTTSEGTVPRLVFFGLKGGVGRSTAIAMLAYQLAKLGKRVLLIDLDLESPGLSGLLLPPDRLADFGVVDWLVEDAVGQGSEVARRMVSSSALSESLRHDIRVTAAIGNGDRYYLDKLLVLTPMCHLGIDRNGFPSASFALSEPWRSRKSRTWCSSTAAPGCTTWPLSASLNWRRSRSCLRRTGRRGGKGINRFSLIGSPGQAWRATSANDLRW